MSEEKSKGSVELVYNLPNNRAKKGSGGKVFMLYMRKFADIDREETSGLRHFRRSWGVQRRVLVGSCGRGNGGVVLYYRASHMLCLTKCHIRALEDWIHLPQPKPRLGRVRASLDRNRTRQNVKG